MPLDNKEYNNSKTLRGEALIRRRLAEVIAHGFGRVEVVVRDGRIAMVVAQRSDIPTEGD